MKDSSIKLINKDALLEQALEQREQLLEALKETEDFLKAMGWEPPSKEQSPTTTAVRQRKRRRAVPPEPKKSLRQVVLEACWIIRDDITRGAVLDYIQNEYPNMEVKEASVGATLSYLKKGQEIEEAQQGSGGKPSVFRVPDSERSD